MKFSVLMSVYYKENPKYLEEAIDSIINQTCKPSEIVLIKDGKLTDELDETIDRYCKKNVGLFNIVELEKNVGLGLALRRGVEECSYDLIARMDTDDIARKDRFEKQLDIFKNDDKIDIVGSYIDEFDKDINNITSTRKVPSTNEDIKIYAKRRCPFNHMTVMYKKEAVLKAGNYKPLHFNEDYYLWIRMIVSGAKAYNIPETLLYARAGDSMFERRGGINYVKTDIQLQREILKMGFINRYEFITNTLIRTTTRILPNKLRKAIYIKLLRK